MTSVFSDMLSSNRPVNKKSPSLPGYAHPARRAGMHHRAQVQKSVVVVVPGRDGKKIISFCMTIALLNTTVFIISDFYNGKPFEVRYPIQNL
jgi:hypothetical protein